MKDTQTRTRTDSPALGHTCPDRHLPPRTGTPGPRRSREGQGRGMLRKNGESHLAGSWGGHAPPPSLWSPPSCRSSLPGSPVPARLPSAEGEPERGGAPGREAPRRANVGRTTTPSEHRAAPRPCSARRAAAVRDGRCSSSPDLSLVTKQAGLITELINVESNV